MFAELFNVGVTLFGMSEANKAGIRDASAARAEGLMRKKAADFSASQMETAAGQELASSQHEAREALRQSEILQSRALAIGGASGAGVNDPTFLKIAGDLAAEGQLAAQTYLARGTEASRNFKLQAEVTRWEGELAKRGMTVQAKSIDAARRNANLAGILSTAGHVWDAAGSFKKTAPKTPTGEGA